MARPYRHRIVSIANRAYSSDPFERVAAIGGTNSDHTRWSLTQDAAISAIEAGTDAFTVKDGGNIVKLVVLIHGGQKYLRTEREKTHPDDLLRLTAR